VPSDDLVDLFALYIKGFRTCPLYRIWGGIALVSGAMERRIYTENDAYINWPNLFVMLAGPPASGKGIIDVVRRLWKSTKDDFDLPAFYVGVDNATKASLVDGLAKAGQDPTHNPTQPYTYNCLLLPMEEFSEFFSTYDPSLLSFLTKMYNAPDDYEEERRGHGKTKIHAPIMSGIWGYQPDVMNKVLLKEGSDQGFLRRIILIWNHRADKNILFTEPPLDENLKKEICKRLGQIRMIKGAMKFQNDAIELLREWDDDDSPYPRPIHHHLQYYNETRTIYAIKLSMIASMSESTDMVIHLRHTERAIKWLLEAEAVMPEVFDNMKEQNSDFDALEGLYAHALLEHSKGLIITDGTLIKWLGRKVPTQRHKLILNTLETIGSLVRKPDGTWRATGKSPRSR
jgi:hypothetical protein